MRDIFGKIKEIIIKIYKAAEERVWLKALLVLIIIIILNFIVNIFV